MIANNLCIKANKRYYRAYLQTVMGKFKKPRWSAKANGLTTQSDRK
jgi:hypothetical protein